MSTKRNSARIAGAAVCLLALLLPLTAAANTAPVVTNVQVSQRANSFLVDISYDVFDAESDSLWVSLYFSPDGGVSWPVRCAAVTGDAGFDVAIGTDRAVVWDARQDYPGFLAAGCRIRVVADDEVPRPYLDRYWRIDAGDTTFMNIAWPDTFGFGRSISVGWQGTAPSVAGLPPEFVAAIDTVYPFDDGLLGYKTYLPDAACDSALADCWQPRMFDEATGDSFSYWSASNSLTFVNDGSGTDPRHMLLPSGLFQFGVNAIDVNGLEIPAEKQSLGFVVNFDPQTVILDGETDWAHPEDPEIYPYYLQLNDPLQIHHPFRAGDRIPDRTYVVFKALGRDDPRDAVLDPGFTLGFTGFMQGVRSNFTGGIFSFATNASEPNFDPPWAANADGWSADTLGFLTGPATEFTINLQAIDEHGRRDGTPASLSFDVGYPPCVQCLELLPKSYQLSAWGPDLACVDDPAVHPCFQDTAVLRVTSTGLGANDLEYVQPIYMLVDKQNYSVRISDSTVGEEVDNYIVQSKLFRLSVLLHGQDDAREAWAESLRRILGWQYQIDYECDPFNSIKDGGGNDDIVLPTWGENLAGTGLDIDPASGLWRLAVDVVVPDDLFRGVDTYLLLLRFLFADGDDQIAQAIFTATTKQFGNGTVRAVALDQTTCGVPPARPGSYHYFKGVRPPLASLPAGQSWRDCDLLVPDIKGSLSLSQGAMRSRGGDPVIRPFRIVVVTDTGDFTCGAQ